MSGRLISLSKQRKARARAASRRKADANSVKFGRSKAVQKAEADDQQRLTRHLDAHRKDDEL